MWCSWLLVARKDHHMLSSAASLLKCNTRVVCVVRHSRVTFRVRADYLTQMSFGVLCLLRLEFHSSQCSETHFPEYAVLMKPCMKTFQSIYNKR